MDLWLVITWAVVTVVLICVELASVQLVAIWFAAGSFAAFIASIFHVTLTPTLIIFVTVSVLLLLLTRPFAKKYLNQKRTATNADSILGKVCIVTAKIDNTLNEGQISVNGLTWTARSSIPDITFEEKEQCTIVAIEGVKAIVKKV